MQWWRCGLYLAIGTKLFESMSSSFCCIVGGNLGPSSAAVTAWEVRLGKWDQRQPSSNSHTLFRWSATAREGEGGQWQALAAIGPPAGRVDRPSAGCCLKTR
jgi:hypothetical protein